MPLNWPDISQNQMFQASLGLLGAGIDRRTNPFLAAQQGLAYGKQADKADKEEARLEEEAARRKRLEDAWGGMFGVPGASPDMAGGGSGIVGGDSMPMPDPSKPYGGLEFGLGMPQGSNVLASGPAADALGQIAGQNMGQMRGPGPQMASTSPDMTGMGGPQMPPGGPTAAPGAPQGNPMLANVPPQMMPLLAALGPEKGIPYLMDAMNRKPTERRIIKGADGYNYYEDGTRVIPGAEKPPEKPTEIQRNLEAAGFEPGTPEYAQKLQEYLFKPNAQVINNLGSNGIDYGKPEPGLVWARNQDGSVKLDERGAPIGVPYQGGSAWRAQQEADAKAQAAAEQEGVQLQTEAGKAETMLDATSSIKGIMEGASTPVTGTSSRPFATFSSTPAGQVRSYVGTLKSGVALGAIQRLKEASATGATGFGAMNEAELQLLIDDIGALDPDTTDPEIFMKTVDRIERRYKRVAEDIKENVSPERIKELGLEPLLSAIDGGGASVDFSTMEPQDLLSVDPGTITTDEAYKKYEAALKAAGLI